MLLNQNRNKKGPILEIYRLDKVSKSSKSFQKQRITYLIKHGKRNVIKRLKSTKKI